MQAASLESGVLGKLLRQLFLLLVFAMACSYCCDADDSIMLIMIQSLTQRIHVQLLSSCIMYIQCGGRGPQGPAGPI
jgi:hypothetical protein